MRTTHHEKERAAREAQLEHMREQVSTGALVIRQMTPAERTRWAKHEAGLPSEERVKRASALQNRRRRPAFS